MSLAGLFEIGLTLALVFAAADTIGAFMADVFNNRKIFLAPLSAAPSLQAVSDHVDVPARNIGLTR